jgi:hypothetical protein
VIELLGGIGGGLFVLSSLVVGGRILLAGLRTGGRPELFIGGGLFLLGGVGYPLVSVGQFATGLSDELRGLCAAGHMFCNVLGVSGIGFFTRQVFRSNEHWALGLALAIGLSETVAMLVQLSTTGAFAFVANYTGPWRLNLYVAFVTLVWAGGESIVYGLRMRRRIALGLADSVLTNRILLWGAAILSASIILLATIVLELAGHQVIGSPVMGVIVGPFGLTASVCLYLAFMPPKSYLRWLEADPKPFHG